jgi:hypothetical protein
MRILLLLAFLAGAPTVAHAGDNSRDASKHFQRGVDLKVPPAPIAAVRAAMNGGPSKDATPQKPGKNFVTGWIVTGVLLAAVVAVGTTTLVEQSKLGSMRNSFPANRADLDRQSSLTTGLAISSDVLGAATLAAAGVATYLTIKYERGKHVNVGLTARGVSVGGTF